MEERIFIDTALCNGCGLCVAVCPYEVLSLAGKTAVFSGEPCFCCGHCQAGCPQQAVRVDGLPATLGLTTLAEREQCPPPGPALAEEVVALMRWRRSCRNYKPDAVAKEILEDLARIGTTAPSGTNSQGWNFIILPERRDLLALGGLCADFFRRLNSLAASSPLRLLSWIFAGDALGRYHRKHLESVAEALRRWDGDRRDLLFHGASAAILVTGRKDASCPAEDALLATANILLAAQAMGLGTCLIGYAVEAIHRSSAIRKSLQLPEDERVYSVIALGFPALHFARPAGRQPITARVVNLAGQ
jgi:nitroreductase/NAD-dependent dihydropyrimidine dehydrogenase PreA subunit